MTTLPETSFTPIKGYEKFVSPCPPPTPHQRELLDILIEECSEVIQRVTKMKRFGVEEIQEGQTRTNAERLSMEVGDLQKMIDLCLENGLMDQAFIDVGYAQKERQLAKYMQTTKETSNDGRS